MYSIDDFTEQQLVDIFKEVGHVVGFRLLFDRDTNKPKGFGFCQYLDSETAASAVRNLNGYEVGGRKLRVDFADSEKEMEVAGAIPMQPIATPPVPQQPSAPAADVIQNLVAQTSPAALVSMLADLKLMVTTRPDDLKKVFTANPQLTYAVFQAMIMMNVVDQTVIGQVLQAQIAQQSQAIAAVNPMVAATVTGYPPALPPQPVAMPLTAPGVAPQPQMDMAAATALAKQQQLLMEILSLREDQIAILPPDERAQVMAIRSQYQQYLPS
ncbi:hypothetical protein SmJEL517_g04144 [Synchytrium microbalum]|uniref:RRM domain-containing protein n=1 Tax=Synchytrium microbalum TaxID=1806994 RepID=A0A507C4C7_9FUNG|nr:uncharacterized protein SmJEL517_g04144 [Synchytrium microbalum]TPX32836.1 hypothetical protein SmJEL517_g04144 [Synchytrium microbalum]